ncbi:MAG: PqqD family protein [Candidatus Omnitrophota bacterium]
MSQELRCFKRNNDVFFKEIEGELYLVDPYRRKLIQINPAGLEIWRLLDGGHSLPTVIAVIEEKFDCNPIDAKRDVVSFVSELEKRELVF